MRILYNVIGLIFLIFNSSCSDFLTVNPKTDISRDDLLSTEAGFQDALIGVYIQLGEDDSYGMDLSMTTIEHLVSSWDATPQSTAGQLGRFNYTDAGVSVLLERIFNKQYKTIASINSILDEMEKRRSLFSPNMYELIKGECLALRAFLHFDILRLFGPVPSSSSQNNNLLPYTVSLSRTASPSLNTAAFKTKLFNDLVEAESLLSKSDPFITYSIQDFKNGTYSAKNDFMNYRYLKMNYYAVKALKARAYLWFNEPSKAYEEATFLIDLKNPNGTVKFKLGEASDFNSTNFVLSNEHIFGLYDHNINTKFATPVLVKGTDETLINTQLYAENIGTDIRASSLWEQNVTSSIHKYVFKKYQSIVNSINLMNDFKQIPMIRISELYLIGIESGNASQAQDLWEEFSRTRGLGQSLPADLQQKQAMLLKEYRREFYGEGQAFYAYKRLNAALNQITFATSADEVNYMPPIPKSESSIN